MIRAIIFDFDGLILDTETPELLAWQEQFAAHGCELPMELWHDCIGRAWHSFDPLELLARMTSEPLDRERISADRRGRNKELLEAMPMMAGVEEYLIEASQLELKVGIASSSPLQWVDGHLRRLRARDNFPTICCAENGLRAKPEPDTYLDALHRLGVEARDAVALEDSPNGVAAAKAAGIYCAAVPNSVTRALDFPLADLRIEALTEMTLEELIRKAESSVQSMR